MTRRMKDRNPRDGMKRVFRPIPALVPRDSAGFQFACYSDCCSGVPGGAHESTFAAVNAAVSRLDPQPEFICFPGDEVRGLTASAEELRRQWRYWTDVEMGWTASRSIVVYHTTGNHTAYDAMSEAIFEEVNAHQPRNGPEQQRGLSYFVRRADLLMVFINTAWSGLGGEGRVETEWLGKTLSRHADAEYKLVFGHHPVRPVNGFSGRYQREIDGEVGRELWALLVEHGVIAYVCSHILAFDVQVHDNVLQIVSAGAGTAPLMPAGYEYHHFLQLAVDSSGLRYQVLDTNGEVRESLVWPLSLPHSDSWPTLNSSALNDHSDHPQRSLSDHRVCIWRFTGISGAPDTGGAQTLICGRSDESALASIWIGLRGEEQRLVVLLSPEPGQSPHWWYGPAMKQNGSFDFQVAIHTGMGPGGILWRENDQAPWSSLTASSPWGAERIDWPKRWAVGHDILGPDDQPFLGVDLRVQRFVSRPATNFPPA